MSCLALILTAIMEVIWLFICLALSNYRNDSILKLSAVIWIDIYMLLILSYGFMEKMRRAMFGKTKTYNSIELDTYTAIDEQSISLHNFNRDEQSDEPEVAKNDHESIKSLKDLKLVLIFGYIREYEESFNQYILIPNNLIQIITNYCQITNRLSELIETKRDPPVIDTFEIDKSIFEKICSLSSFNSKEQLLIKDIVKYKNEKVLINIVKYWKYDQMSSLLRKMLCVASENKMYNLCNHLLLTNDEILNLIDFNPRPQCLLNAVKSKDNEMINLILKGLKRKKNFCFICDDVFSECIKIDHIECAKSIVENGWYTPTEKDSTVAKQYYAYGSIHLWLLQRSQTYIINDVNNQNIVDLEDWDSQENENDYDENDQIELWYS